MSKGEFSAVFFDDLDVGPCALHLHGEWTKNRKPGFRPLPSALVERLKALAESGAVPSGRLLYVPSHAARELDKDLQAAGIPKQTVQGRIDFHSLRVTFVTLISESGASVKETQHLARHSTLDLTFNIYAKAREDRLSKVVEAVGKAVNPGEKKYAGASGGRRGP